eukprot:jgi/Tetstr1/455974/TSEL_042754.t1
MLKPPIDKASRFRLAFMRRLNAVKRVHGDQGVFDVLQAYSTFNMPSSIWAFAIFGDMMKDYEQYRVFEATLPAARKLPLLLLGWRQCCSLNAAVDVDVDLDMAELAGVAAKVSTNDGVGRLSSELLALCAITFWWPPHRES